MNVGIKGRTLDMGGIAGLIGAGVGRKEGLYGGGCGGKYLGGVAVKDVCLILYILSSCGWAKLVA